MQILLENCPLAINTIARLVEWRSVSTRNDLNEAWKLHAYSHCTLKQPKNTDIVNLGKLVIITYVFASIPRQNWLQNLHSYQQRTGKPYNNESLLFHSLKLISKDVCFVCLRNEGVQEGKSKKWKYYHQNKSFQMECTFSWPKNGF